MYQIAGAAQMKELDRQAIEEYGVSSLGLMERAAQAVAEEVRGLLEGGGPDFIGGAASVAVLGAGAETEEDRRELEALQALAEEKNQDHAPWVGAVSYTHLHASQFFHVRSSPLLHSFCVSSGVQGSV